MRPDPEAPVVDSHETVTLSGIVGDQPVALLKTFMECAAMGS
jgi:hypothetical protein